MARKSCWWHYLISAQHRPLAWSICVISLVSRLLSQPLVMTKKKRQWWRLVTKRHGLSSPSFWNLGVIPVPAFYYRVWPLIQIDRNTIKYSSSFICVWSSWPRTRGISCIIHFIQWIQLLENQKGSRWPWTASWAAAASKSSMDLENLNLPSWLLQSRQQLYLMLRGPQQSDTDFVTGRRLGCTSSSLWKIPRILWEFKPDQVKKTERKPFMPWKLKLVDILRSQK